ncbi:MAG: hypothetical protein KJ017_12590 [Alphaproteobacteria bacterium]|nr:hypothetical protein [Alphaproteobacteria bacterium]
MSSRLYVENRIREALKKARGNKNLARQQLIAWTYEDAKLLHALTRPHLDGIIAYNIDRLLSGRGEAAKEEGVNAKTAAKTPPPAARKAKVDDFGMELLRAVAASDAAIFGQETGAPPAKRGQASRRHVDALMKMAASVERKKPKTDKT